MKDPVGDGLACIIHGLSRSVISIMYRDERDANVQGYQRDCRFPLERCVRPGNLTVTKNSRTSATYLAVENLYTVSQINLSSVDLSKLQYSELHCNISTVDAAALLKYY